MAAGRTHAARVEYASPDAALGRKLLPVARKIFTDTFAGRYPAADFETFCDRTYAADGPMANDLADDDIGWRVAVVDGEPVGYAKLTPLRAPAAGAAPDAMELQQLYVLAAWHGSGIADRLMAWAIDAARRRGATELYLTVFEHNERARRFYARHGFAETGRCTFTLGSRIDEDCIWRRRLAAT